jgi:ankyrin repeat protein
MEWFLFLFFWQYHKTPLSATILKRTTRNPLYAASPPHHNFSDPEEIIDMLVNKYKADVNKRDKSQHTPLHWAAYLGYKEAVQILLDSGRADIKAKNYVSIDFYYV